MCPSYAEQVGYGQRGAVPTTSLAPLLGHDIITFPGFVTSSRLLQSRSVRDCMPWILKEVPGTQQSRVQGPVIEGLTSTARFGAAFRPIRWTLADSIVVPVVVDASKSYLIWLILMSSRCSCRKQQNLHHQLFDIGHRSVYARCLLRLLMVSKMTFLHLDLLTPPMGGAKEGEAEIKATVSTLVLPRFCPRTVCLLISDLCNIGNVYRTRNCILFIIFCRVSTNS